MSILSCGELLGRRSLDASGLLSRNLLGAAPTVDGGAGAGVAPAATAGSC